ncbi:MAG: type II secretion system F family protein [bacterium]|nr:type II secretion system F family protein [bacterium]MDE0288929.1 type II secretion system F family protein [bacterium]MDE0437399.1 type II secretion system F family protein [bacterium]
MTRFTVLAVAAVVYGVLPAHPTGVRLVSAAGAAIGLSNPVAGAGAAVFWFSFKRHRALRQTRLARQSAEGELELLTHSMLIGLSGGLSPAAALLLARETIGSGLRDEIDQVMRRSVQEGLAGSLLNSRGVGGRLFRQVGAAQLSGAPLGLALTALATEQRAATRARAVERARRLPVKMVLPITLLMLPGLLILMVGPLVLPAVARLLGPMVSL